MVDNWHWMPQIPAENYSDDRENRRGKESFVKDHLVYHEVAGKKVTVHHGERKIFGVKGGLNAI